MRVAYIGLGSMGGDQARLIARSAHDLTVFDVSAEARDRFQGMASVADSIAAAVADAELIHVCVRDKAQVNAVLFDAGGVASGARTGALVIVHSTIDVAGVREIAQQLKESGLLFADAPVTRTRLDGDGRFVLSMFGGDEASFARARAVLETFSTDVLHVGECGAAMALKIANNMMTWTQLVVGDLVFQLARSHGIQWEHLKAVTRANGNLTPVTEAFLGGARANPLPLTPSQLAFNASQAGIGEKDLALAIAACASHGIDTRMLDVARELLRPAMVCA